MRGKGFVSSAFQNPRRCWRTSRGAAQQLAGEVPRALAQFRVRV